MLSFASGEVPKTEPLEGTPGAERPQTIDARAAERLRRTAACITPENADAIVTHLADADMTGFANETVTPEILQERERMVESARQDLAPMLSRLNTALMSTGRGSPEANAILREIADRLNAPLGAGGRNRASIRVENDAIALASGINGTIIDPDTGGRARLRVQAGTEPNGAWAMTVSTVER